MVTIGVTGHRFLAEVDKLEAGVDQALTEIERVFGGPVTVISALAEGADRLVAERALARPGSALEVVLPLPRAEYLTDFRSAESKGAFERLLGRARRVIQIPTQSERDQAYLAGGEHVIRQADVLLAVWDGQEQQAKGGTGSIVRRARDLGLPIAWVHAGNRVPDSEEPTSLGPDQGRVTYESFVPQHPHFDMVDAPADRERWAPLREALDWCEHTVTAAYLPTNAAALRHQKPHRLISYIVGGFGTLVVLFAVLQLSGLIPLAWLSSGELIAALVAVASVTLGLLAAHQSSWLLERHKAERCRLLKFKLLSDPDYWSGDPDERAAAEQRIRAELAQIEPLDAKTLGEWVEQDTIPDPPLDLERGGPLTETLRSLVGYYGAKRLGVQIRYFTNRAGQNHFLDRISRPFSPVLFFLSVAAAGGHFLYDWLTGGHGNHLISTGLILLAAALPVIGGGVRTIRGAHEFARNRSRFRAKEVALTHLAQRLRSETDPARIFADLWCCEQILESEHREWLWRRSGLGEASVGTEARERREKRGLVGVVRGRRSAAMPDKPASDPPNSGGIDYKSTSITTNRAASRIRGMARMAARLVFFTASWLTPPGRCPLLLW